MTEQELRDVFDEPNLIAHENMRDVAFYPIGIEIQKDVYKLNGIWYSKTLQGLFSYRSEAAREIITVKKEDLQKWKILDLHTTNL
jgi:hypothetical protein